METRLKEIKSVRQKEVEGDEAVVYWKLIQSNQIFLCFILVSLSNPVHPPLSARPWILIHPNFFVLYYFFPVSCFRLLNYESKEERTARPVEQHQLLLSPPVPIIPLLQAEQQTRVRLLMHMLITVSTWDNVPAAPHLPASTCTYSTLHIFLHTQHKQA